MSRAPVPDQRLYDAIYQERYSGLLDKHAEGYEEGSPITHAENLQGTCCSCKAPVTTMCTIRAPSG
jgi:dipeptidyl aminopeptidase/acylaminoacyl peptidase